MYATATELRNHIDDLKEKKARNEVFAVEIESPRCEPITNYTRSLHVTRSDVNGYVVEYMLAARGGYVRTKMTNVNNVRLVTGAEVARGFKVGTPVYVHKYAGTYRGVVTKVGRTQVSVRFHTKTTGEKNVTVPAVDVQKVR